MDCEGHCDGRPSVQLIRSGSNLWGLFLFVAQNSGRHPLVSGFEICRPPQACTSTSGFEAGNLPRRTSMAPARSMQLVLSNGPGKGLIDSWVQKTHENN